MGGLGSKGKPKEDRSALHRSAAIDKLNASDAKEESTVIKLLLLGAGESGKSTLFKQMIQLYGQGFDQASLEGYRDNIHNNVLNSMSVLCLQTDVDGEKIGCVTSPGVQASKDMFLQAAKAGTDLVLTPELARHVTTLWADPAIKKAFYSHRSRMQIPDSADYFFENAERVAEAKYVPCYQDVLRVRARTTGIVETTFNYKKDIFKLIDVGGQRNERKKWIHCFEGVTAVLFVAAISEYDQTLYEDNTQNRLHEALTLFGEMVNAAWFDRSSMILFLNKRDLFAEKVNHVDLSVCFPDYKDGADEAKAAQFIERKFLEMCKKPDKKIFTHVTCATDDENVRFTFTSVRQTIIDESLKRSGLQ